MHYHVIVPDALFYRDALGALRREVLRRPSRGELEGVTYNVSVRCLKWLRKYGHLEDEDSKAEPTMMEMCLSGSVGLGNLAALSKKGETKCPTDHKPGAASHKVRGGAFNIHVGEPASGKEEREQLIRYCARAPLSLERLSVSADGKVVYQLKHPIGGKTHRVMEPHQFLARLCALIPPPRHPLIRFHGVFGPASKWRAEVVPSQEPESSGCARPEENNIDDARQAESKWSSQRLDWATLLHRVYDIDALRCECGGELRFEELIESPKDAQDFLVLHQIESPRTADSQAHVESWSDAPNVALVNGLRPDKMIAGEQEEDPSSQAATRSTSGPPESDWDCRDELPSEEAYFRDEVPPD